MCEKAEEEETEWNLQMMGNWKVSFLNRKRKNRQGSQVLNVVIDGKPQWLGITKMSQPMGS